MLIGDKIKMVRKKFNMSLDAFGKVTNFSPSYISLFEKNKRIPSNETLGRIKASIGYEGVPLTKEEVDKFKRELYDFYAFIKNRRLIEARENSNRYKLLVEKSFEPELNNLYCLFESYLLMRESHHKEAKDLLSRFTYKLSDLTDEQQYFYHYFYAGSIYYDYKQTLCHLLKAEEIGRMINKLEANLYYSISNMYSRIDCSSKSIIYGTIALEMTKNSYDKAYLYEIESTIAFEHAKLGCHQLALDKLLGYLQTESLAEAQRQKILYHNIGCVYMFMQDFENAITYFKKALNCCNLYDWSYLNNKLHIAYTLIYDTRKDEALDIIKESLPHAKDKEDMKMLFESAKHSLSLYSKDSLNYIENITIPLLLEMGKYLKAIEYMKIISDFFEISKSKIENKKSSDYSKLAFKYTYKILKGDIYL